MTTKNFQKRIDKDLYDRVAAIYNDLGTSVGEAFVMFLKKSEEVQGLPFELRKSSDVMSDQELEDLLLSRLEHKRIDLDNSDDVAEFFDEEFPEYEVNHG
ncbi:type II toxin-antitoxin system RelB/DinJ family antitoxin [Streptococcus orisasini]